MVLVTVHNYNAKLVKNFLCRSNVSHKLRLRTLRHTAEPIIGNDCANRERLRERLRKLSDIFLFSLLQETLNFASENNKNLKEI